MSAGQLSPLSPSADADEIEELNSIIDDLRSENARLATKVASAGKLGAHVERLVDNFEEHEHEQALRMNHVEESAAAELGRAAARLATELSSMQKDMDAAREVTHQAEKNEHRLSEIWRTEVSNAEAEASVAESG